MASKKRLARNRRIKQQAILAEENRLKKLGIHPDQLKEIKYQFKDLKQGRAKYLRETKTYSSHNDNGRGNTNKKESLMYTGDKLLGIATMHKSNMVPVFDSQSAEDLAKMRRN